MVAIYFRRSRKSDAPCGRTLVIFDREENQGASDAKLCEKIAMIFSTRYTLLFPHGCKHVIPGLRINTRVRVNLANFFACYRSRVGEECVRNFIDTQISSTLRARPRRRSASRDSYTVSFSYGKLGTEGGSTKHRETDSGRLSFSTTAGSISE